VHVVNIGQALRVAYASFIAGKLRSALTMLGMLTGVWRGHHADAHRPGSQATVEAQFNSLGTNLIYVEAGITSAGGIAAQAGSVNTLAHDDAQAIANPYNVPDASLVAAEVCAAGQLIYQSQNAFGRIEGVTSEYAYVHNYHVSQGGRLTPAQVEGSANVTVLGATVAQTLFGDTNPVGLQVRVNTGGPNGGRSATLQIIGVGKAMGGPGFDNPDTEDLCSPHNRAFEAQFKSGGAARGGRWTTRVEGTLSP
jgi:putative ABC transport system permease protein